MLLSNNKPQESLILMFMTYYFEHNALFISPIFQEEMARILNEVILNNRIMFSNS